MEYASVMKYYVVAYDRRAGRTVSESVHVDRAEAVRARSLVQAASPRGTEVVILGATSKEALHKTHARYYESAGKLASSM
jgi:hypothetical protein